MGSVNLDNTGSGSAITLSSDGTSLLLDGTAVGGGGGGLDLFVENYDGTSTLPTATGSNSITVGANAASSGTDSIALGRYVTASGFRSTALGRFTTASGQSSTAIGSNALSAETSTIAIGFSRAGDASNAMAINIANNTASYGATGLQSTAMGQLAKSTAAQSISMGNTSFASGVKSMALGGYYARSEGENSLALGSYSLAENVGSVAIGPYSQAKTIGKVAFNASSTGSMTTGPGKQQRGLYILKATTADATQTVLTGNGSTPDASNSWIIGIAAAQAFSGTLIARQDRDDGHDYAAWEIKGAALRNATVVELGTAIVNKLYNSTGASAWAIAVSANTTLGTIEIKVTGAASTDIDWVATIDTSELVNI